jgi:predicted dinucleotide-binding enzyme
MLSNSCGPQTLSSTMISIGCNVGTVADAAAFGDVVFVAIPCGQHRSIPANALQGKIVVDANNYPDRDGAIAELDNRSTTTSEMLARHLPDAKVVKAFNAILERDIELCARPGGSADRRALPIAGNDAFAKQLVSELHEQLGFDVVDAGRLSDGWRFERARPAYCVPLSSADLKKALADSGPNVPEGSWRK